MVNGEKVALITGGAKRVGRAIALKLKEAGFRIAITCRSSEDEARELADRAFLIRADLADLPEAAEQIQTRVTEEFGRLDVLVNNASAYLPSRLADTDLSL